MTKLRVVFMGTPEFAVPPLDAIHEASAHHEIVAVYTQPDKAVGRGLELKPTPVKKRALELGLPVFQPEKLSPPEELERLKSFRPDVVVVVAYGKILKQSWLDVPRLGFVNIHSSLLPRWRGAAPIQWAILGGDSESGVTTMRLVEKLDAGDILLQSKTPVSGDDTAGSLHDRLSKMGAELIVPTLNGLASGEIRGIAQDESQVTYASKLTKEMEWLDPSKSARQLGLNVRGLSPWPGTSLWIDDGQGKTSRLKVKRARPHADISGPQGKIFEKAGMVLLGTSEGALELLTVQWDGKKEVDAGGFLNGLKGRGQALPLQTVAPPVQST
ncbi:MAG: methionyl-tRNA formyltransferase [Bdellovibrionia bacterium]